MVGCWILEPPAHRSWSAVGCLLAPATATPTAPVQRSQTQHPPQLKANEIKIIIKPMKIIIKIKSKIIGSERGVTGMGIEMEMNINLEHIPPRAGSPDWHARPGAPHLARRECAPEPAQCNLPGNRL